MEWKFLNVYCIMLLFRSLLKLLNIEDFNKTMNIEVIGDVWTNHMKRYAAVFILLKLPAPISHT